MSAVIVRTCLHIYWVVQNHVIFIRCVYGIFSREITIHTVIYGAHIRFWPTLHTYHCVSHPVSPTNSKNEVTNQLPPPLALRRVSRAAQQLIEKCSVDRPSDAHAQVRV